MTDAQSEVSRRRVVGSLRPKYYRV